MPGPHEARCASCGSALADDQRYCLSCGTRHGEARRDLIDALAPPRAPEHEVVRETVAPAPGGPRSVSPLGVALLTALLLLAIGSGALLRGGSPPPAVNVAAAPAPDVTVNAGGGGTGGGTEEATLVSDWSGDDGWTVQLQVLPKEETTPDAVTTAKQDALAQGAPDVGALDSDEYPSLAPGEYVVYSGEFGSRKDARPAFKKLRKDFPDAQVIEVSVAGGAGSAGEGTEEVAKDPEAVSLDEEAKDILEGPQDGRSTNKLPEKYQTEGEAPKKVPPSEVKDEGGATIG